MTVLEGEFVSFAYLCNLDPQRSSGTNDVVEPRDRHRQHFLIEKEQSRQRLILGRSSHRAFDRQIGQKAFDPGSSHGARMPLSMKQNKATNPTDVGLFCAIAEML